MTYDELMQNAKAALSGVCHVCPDCNGIACRGQVPGVGAKGDGAAFTICREYLNSIKLNMDAVHEHFDADMSIELFGRSFKYPFFVAPIGGMALNYGGKLSESEYCESVIKGAREAGILAFSGDGPDDSYFTSALPFIEGADGCVIPTIKPWDQKKCFERIDELKKYSPVAFAMDIDSASLINLKLKGKPVYTKSGAELAELVKAAEGIPFIVKGIMTEDSAARCQQAGTYGVVVSSHAGRVMRDCPAPASVVSAIRKNVGRGFKLFVDGGVRSGSDVFKCLALGADAVLLGRPFAIAAFGGRAEGVSLFANKIGAELSETMLMTGCPDLASINSSKLSKA